MKNLVTAVWTGFGRRLSRLAVMRLTLLGLVLALAVGVLVATVGSGNGRLRSGTDPGRLSNRALANEIYSATGLLHQDCRGVLRRFRGVPRHGV
jgi:hypothetical protein